MKHLNGNVVRLVLALFQEGARLFVFVQFLNECSVFVSEKISTQETVPDTTVDILHALVALYFDQHSACPAGTNGKVGGWPTLGTAFRISGGAHLESFHAQIMSEKGMKDSRR